VTCLALALAGVGDRAGQLTHAVMGVAMAGMFSPWGDPVPGWLGAAGFTVLGAWFAAAVLRRDRAAHAAHLAISSAAMAVMYLLHRHPQPAAAHPGAGGHAAHSAAGGGAQDLLVVPLALLLAGYFAWHAWTCTQHLPIPSAAARGAGPAGRHAAAPTPARASARIEPVAHGTMSALMAAMFLGAI
jgi:hypothetical protein